jgi:hypothetical protein
MQAQITWIKKEAQQNTTGLKTQAQSGSAQDVYGHVAKCDAFGRQLHHRQLEPPLMGPPAGTRRNGIMPY